MEKGDNILRKGTDITGKGEFQKTGVANSVLLPTENLHKGNSCAFSVKLSCYFYPAFFFTPATLSADMMSKNAFSSRFFASLSQGAAVVLVRTMGPAACLG